MYKDYEILKLKEVHLNGDAFWLTIPPTTIFKKLIEDIWEERIKNAHTLWGEAGAVTFNLHTTVYGNQTIFYQELQHNAALTTATLGDCDSSAIHLQDAHTYLRPCLIPMAKDGKYDRTFMDAAGNGSIFRGGYLALKSSMPNENGWDNCFGDSLKKSNTTRESLRVTITPHCGEISIVEDWVGEKEAEPPLEWFFYDGILLCTYNIGYVTIDTLRECGLLPTL